jgi:hypothetical protein
MLNVGFPLDDPSRPGELRLAMDSGQSTDHQEMNMDPAPREGPAGWRSVVSAPGSGEPAIWQPEP